MTPFTGAEAAPSDRAEAVPRRASLLGRLLGRAVDAGLTPLITAGRAGEYPLPDNGMITGDAARMVSRAGALRPLTM